MASVCILLSIVCATLSMSWIICVSVERFFSKSVLCIMEDVMFV